MNYESDCFFRSWRVKETDPETEVVEMDILVTETKLPSLGIRIMGIVGDETNLRIMYRGTCAFCPVKNTTTGLVPIVEGDTKALSYNCAVDEQDEYLRLCVNDADLSDIDEEEYQRVPENNWHSMLTGDMDELLDDIGDERVSIDMGLLRDEDFVILCGHYE